jgi:ATP-dependent RNA helicase DDX19/DBP5
MPHAHPLTHADPAHPHTPVPPQRKVDADRLAVKMQQEGHSVTVLHGGQDADQRDVAIDDFRDGKSKVLITTNVLARGTDIQQVNLVINYDMPGRYASCLLWVCAWVIQGTRPAHPHPRPPPVDQSMRADPETYLHRIGRTGRFGRTGVSINFVHDESSYREMKAIEGFFGREIVRVPTDDYEAIEAYLKKFVK